ncbi:MAG: acetyl-CoA carboxylase carboxyltransferase subunit beta [Bacteroidetes bacterium]|nr:acetyl-CoA carboxylase carboxyltransferase subunit beta [Bacteroidota bacterium]
MAWFIKDETIKKPSSKSLWVKCKKCSSHVYDVEWKENLNVCPICNFHGSITSRQRADLIFDKGSFNELFANIGPVDSLKFVDLKGSYKDKFEENKKKAGINEAVLTGHGKINGIKAVASIMDFRFLGGSLGSGTGEKILQGANFALEHKMPYIVFSESGGARMQEGVLSLMQMAKTCSGVAKLNKKNIPFISVLVNPTTGGVTASYAMMGDINIAEPFAVIGFAGRRVIEQTIGEKLPDDFQTAEYLLEHGFVDAIVNRKDMKDYLSNVLSYYNLK